MNQSSATETHDLVKDYYGKVLSSSKDLKTSACCTADAAPSYLLPLFKQVPSIIKQKYYGCGFPVPPAIDGAAVLDLGCGTGRDVYLAAQMIGDKGKVVGVDMTDEQISVAQDHKADFISANNLREDQIDFVQGYIEKLDEAGLKESTFDVVISNCVVNLSPDKRQVLEGVHRVLKDGGEFYFSDVFVDRRLPDEIGKDEILYGECLGGALYHHDFIFLANDVGFQDVRRVTAREIEIHDKKIKALIGNTRFYSITYRLFKVSSLDRQCEDYGQTVTYNGGIEGSDTLYWFDETHAFELGRPERVCGNTYDMLKGRYERYFTFNGDRSTHYGKYMECDTMAAATYKSASKNTDSGSCC
jgi:arsenite methyltransferase